MIYHRGNPGYPQKFIPQPIVHKEDFPPVEKKRFPGLAYPELDMHMAKSFLYITNFSKRDYQFDISLAAVKENTLVVIPTGLGKTFISAMVILNFYRWFPKGKILFLATSRPLVTQQMSGIRDILRVDKSDIIELTGSVDPKVRPDLWNKARIIFATPQTVQRDLEKGTCPASSIVLVVIDEAHHATGDHSYCKVVAGIAEYTNFFRVVGLSATPGSDKDIIQDVIYGLYISNIQFRDDADFKQYVKTRDIESIVVPNAPGVDELVARLNTVIKRYLQVLSKDNLVPHTDPTRTTKGQIGLLMKNRNANEGVGVMISTLKLLKFREYLQNYSIKSFINEATELFRDPGNKDSELIAELQPIVTAATKQPQTDPKMEKLCEIVVDFLSSTDDSRIIVFCNFRNIVQDIVTALSANPIVKVSEFIGQSNSNGMKGLNQNRQVNLIQSFKKGIYNVLVATAIGEEGLDIGEVDMIICYDIQKSMTRTIQRMGRTGRKRDGKVIFLLSDNQKNLLADSSHATSQICALLRKQMKDFVFYKGSPVMNPFELDIIERTTDQRDEEVEERKSTKTNSKRKTLTNDEISELNQRHGTDLIYRAPGLTSHVELQSSLGVTNLINHSNETNLFSSLSSMIFEYKIASQSQNLFNRISDSTSTTSSQRETSSTPPPPPSPYQLKGSFPIEISQHELIPEIPPQKKDLSELIFGFKLDSSSSTSSDDELFVKKPNQEVRKIDPDLLAEKLEKEEDLGSLHYRADVSSIRREYNESQAKILSNSSNNGIQQEETVINDEGPIIAKPNETENRQTFIEDSSSDTNPPDEVFRIYTASQIDKMANMESKKESSSDNDGFFIDESSDFIESDDEEILCAAEKPNAAEERFENAKGINIEKYISQRVTQKFDSTDSQSEYDYNESDDNNFIVESSSSQNDTRARTKMSINEMLGRKTQSKPPNSQLKLAFGSSSDFDLSSD